MLKTTVFLNGNIVGHVDNPADFIAKFRDRRRKDLVLPEVTISYNKAKNCVYVNSDEGRIVRPVIIVEGGVSKLTDEHLQQLRDGKMCWNDLLKNGIIEYLDTEEEENCIIALREEDLTPQHTHLEIDSMLILGLCAAVIPFIHHDDSARSLMGSKYTKQTLGLPASNLAWRMDTQFFSLYYPQKPVTPTKVHSLISYDKRASGQNFVVAVLSYEGYNMEDAVVVNKSSIERGLGRANYYRTYVAEERRYPGGQKDRFEKPTEKAVDYMGPDLYNHISEDGLAEPEEEVSGGDVIIGKTSPPRFLEEISEFGIIEEKRRENSVTVREESPGIIDTVLLTEDAEGNKMSKVRIRTPILPQYGDKFTSLHGQKGVIGLMPSYLDMPFTPDGVVPDLIINPHGLAKRRTVGHLLEMLAGKAASVSGETIDSTAFRHVDEEGIGKILMKAGFRSCGKEVLYNGITGEKIAAEIFIGVITYHRLKHIASLKMHARSRGPVQMLTRQPTEGRAREGGLRFGEMEKDCLVGSGAALLLKERMVDESDKALIYICSKCGVSAIFDRKKNRMYCPICKESRIYPVETTYAFRLFLDELKAMCIYPKILLGDRV